MTQEREDRIAELEKMLDEAAGYVLSCIGSSYCETSKDDLKFLNEIEDLLGQPRTTANMFY